MFYPLSGINTSLRFLPTPPAPFRRTRLRLHPGTVYYSSPRLRGLGPRPPPRPPPRRCRWTSTLPGCCCSARSPRYWNPCPRPSRGFYSTPPHDPGGCRLFVELGSRRSQRALVLKTTTRLHVPAQVRVDWPSKNGGAPPRFKTRRRHRPETKNYNSHDA